MPYQTITISTAASSAAQTSTVAFLSWRAGRPATAAIYPSTTGNSSGTFTLQYTLDDPQLVGGSSLAVWANFATSSAVGSSGTIFSASSISVDGTYFTFLSPIAALRINSTSGLATGPITMKVIQGEP